MRRTESQSRAIHFSLTATTLMALAAVVVGAPAFTGTAGAQHGAKIVSLGDSPTVRAVAAAVAAAAREIIGGQHLDGSVGDAPVSVVFICPTAVHSTAQTNHRPGGIERVGLRLLDLPPPVC